jgi:hypothetical protein
MWEFIRSMNKRPRREGNGNVSAEKEQTVSLDRRGFVAAASAAAVTFSTKKSTEAQSVGPTATSSPPEAVARPTTVIREQLKNVLPSHLQNCRSELDTRRVAD